MLKHSLKKGLIALSLAACFALPLQAKVITDVEGNKIELPDNVQRARPQSNPLGLLFVYGFLTVPAPPVAFNALGLFQLFALSIGQPLLALINR